MSEQQSQNSEEDITIKVYVSSSAGNTKRGHQTRIEQVLEAKKIKFVTLDTAEKEEGHLNKMREIMEDPKGLAPQICNGDTYCGDYDMMNEANENGELEEFLKLPPKPKVES